MPTSGKNCLFLDRQTIRWKTDFQGSIDTKSIDFSFKFKDLSFIFYAFHKYTNEEGGAQDNQFNDIKHSITEGISNIANNDIFIFFICDGNYYNFNRINILKQIASRNSNIKVIKIYELEEVLNSL